jgi:hypothetical protein
VWVCVHACVRVCVCVCLPPLCIITLANMRTPLQVAEAAEVAQHSETLGVTVRDWLTGTQEGADKLGQEVKRRMAQRRDRLSTAERRARWGARSALRLLHCS